MTPALGGISKRQQWIGRVLGAVVTLAFLGSAGTKLAHVSTVVAGLTRAGIPEGAILPIGILELTCLALYWFPRTSILGTFLLTGFLGGAVVTHIIARQSFAPPLSIGMFMFWSAYLRHPELRKLVPFRATDIQGQAYETNWRSQAARG